MSNSSDWQPQPGGVWDTFFTDLGFDSPYEDLDRCRLQCVCSEEEKDDEY